MSNKVRSARSPDTSSVVFHNHRAQRARVPMSHRSNDGIDVTLYWHPALDDLTVCVPLRALCTPAPASVSHCVK